MQVRWNQNGNWLLTASRDHLLKLFDIRAMKEMQTFRGHKREATGSTGSHVCWLLQILLSHNIFSEEKSAKFNEICKRTRPSKREVFRVRARIL